MSKKTELLKYIAKINKESTGTPTIADIEIIQKELEYIKGRKSAALTRITEQEKEGNRLAAKRSRRAFNYCCKYEKQLKNILDGYTKHKGKHYTKDGTQRFIEAWELPKK